MRDPFEGLTADGVIRTGVRRDRVSALFEPVLTAAVGAVSALRDNGAVEIHLYGSVATGQARPGRSDVDLMAIGLPEQQAEAIARRLSAQFVEMCRGVEIGTATAADFAGDNDERYGNRVFLRHYCLPLFGPDALRDADPFRGDARAARGFNGDIGLCLDRWRSDSVRMSPAALGRKVARKTLVTTAGLVSVHDATWTTDRGSSARRWSEVEPRWAASLARLSAWSSDGVADGSALRETLAPDGVVAAIVARFAADIGLWRAVSPDGSRRL
jgi:predicted nucleotidyltransferase